MNDEAVIEIQGVGKRFGDVVALSDVDLTVMRGELFGVLGPSGCGKTTLLRLIMGFERPDDGSIALRGRPLADAVTWIPPERRRIGVVVQDYALFPHLTVARNVAFGLRRMARDSRRPAVRRALELVGLQHKGERYPHELSGGERQRVALARALAPEPEVVLLDEPFSSLDATLRGELRRDVELILREADATAVLVTHDQQEALAMSDRLAVMRDGRIVQVGRPGDIYWRPAESWVARFVGDVNVIPGVAEDHAVRTELGVFDLLGAAAPAGRVQVAVRPEQLQMRRDELGNAEIVEREFRGHDVLYRLRHESGRQVLVQLPSIDLREVGDKVFVRPNPDCVVALVE